MASFTRHPKTLLHRIGGSVFSALIILCVSLGTAGANDLPAIYREARSALEAGDPQRCADLLAPALREVDNAQAAPAQLALGIAWMRLDKPEEAIVVLGKAATHFDGKPEGWHALVLLGDALRSTGRSVDARRRYAQAAEGDAEHPKVRYARARLSELDGEGAQSAGDWAKAAEEYLRAADGLLELGRQDSAYLVDARALYEKVAKGTGKPGKDWRGEPTARAVYGLGQVEQAAGRLPEAIAYYQRTFVSWVRYAPWAARAYLRAAECMDKLGKRDFAIRHLRELVRKIDRFGKLPEYQQAKQQLRAWGEDIR